MATYYNITATIAFDQIEADSPQEAAAKAYAEITHKPAPATPERILVWETKDKPAGGVVYTSTAWTFDQEPKEIVYQRPELSNVPAPVEPAPEQVVAVPVEACGNAPVSQSA